MTSLSAFSRDVKQYWTGRAETIVQTIQNGLGSPEIAAPILGADRIAVGVVGGLGLRYGRPAMPTTMAWR